jgi:Domain of unknown function (DUF4917)
VRDNAHVRKATRNQSYGQTTGLRPHSLAATDDHILCCITDGKVKALYVSLYGDPESDSNKEIRQRAELIAAARPERKRLELAFYDAESASIWVA